MQHVAVIGSNRLVRRNYSDDGIVYSPCEIFTWCK